MVYRNNGVHPRHSGTPQTIIIQFDCCQVKRERRREGEIQWNRGVIKTANTRCMLS